jgi:hypothetical protein
MNNQSITQSLPPQYVTTIAVDTRGYVRVSGVCIGRLIEEGDVVYFEVKDRNAERSLLRGAQMIRVPAGALIRTLSE